MNSGSIFNLNGHVVYSVVVAAGEDGFNLAASRDGDGGRPDAAAVTAAVYRNAGSVCIITGTVCIINGDVRRFGMSLAVVIHNHAAGPDGGILQRRSGDADGGFFYGGGASVDSYAAAADGEGVSFIRRPVEAAARNGDGGRGDRRLCVHTRGKAAGIELTFKILTVQGDGGAAQRVISRLNLFACNIFSTGRVFC